MEKKKNSSCIKGCFRFITRGVGLLALLAFLAIGGYIFLRGAGAYLIIADELQPAQAIVMLSGGDDSRMQEALSLYNDNYGKVIILTETGRQLEKFDTLHSNDIRIQLLNNGVPSGNILITDIKVSSTLDEAYAIKKLLTNQQFSSAIIVTDPYHTRRTALIFHSAFSDSPIKLIFRPVRGSWFNSRTWFLSVDGWKYTILEYLKLFGYYLGIKES
ncbi:MAG: YdcF family protein [Pelolinea sp.]|nr:YdcF family protein [Pelolinea sp.]